MKLNKHIALIALVAGGLLAGSALQAQDAPKDKPPGPPAGGPGGPGGMRAPNPEKLAETLGLSEEQKPKFKTAMEERQKKSSELRADTSLAQEDRRAKRKEIMDASNAKIKEILTPEQYDKFIKMTPGPRNRPAAPPAGGEKPTEKPAAKN